MSENEGINSFWLRRIVCEAVNYIRLLGTKERNRKLHFEGNSVVD